MRIGRYKKPLYYIARQWRYLAFILALTLLYSVTAAMQPWPMKILVDHALRHDTLPAALQSVLDRLVPLTVAENIGYGRLDAAREEITVRRADRILVLDRGRLVETGTHDQLLEHAGRYAYLHQLQTAPVLP